MNRRKLIALSTAALVGAAVGISPASAQWRRFTGRRSRTAGPKYCAPGSHIWVPIGTAPGTGRLVLRCMRCGLTKIQ